MKGFRYLENVATLRLDADKCVGCGMCATVCPHKVYELHDRKAVIRDLDACMECGACARNCPVEALTVHAGVGCAGAIIKSWITGGPATCGCDEGGCC